MEELLTCSVCCERFSEVFRPPVLLPRCGHSFCRLCVAMLLSGGAITCPTCRTEQRVEGSHKLPTEYSLLAIIAAQESEKLKNCQRHDAKVSFWCRTCNEATCGECLFEDHPTTSHDVIRSKTFISNIKDNVQDIAGKFMDALDMKEQSHYRTIFLSAMKINEAMRNIAVLRNDMNDARELMNGVRTEDLTIQTATSLAEAAKFLGLKWNIQDANYAQKEAQKNKAAKSPSVNVGVENKTVSPDEVGVETEKLEVAEVPEVKEKKVKKVKKVKKKKIEESPSQVNDVQPDSTNTEPIDEAKPKKSLKKSKTIAAFEPLNMTSDIVEIRENTVELDTKTNGKESFEIKKKHEKVEEIDYVQPEFTNTEQVDEAKPKKSLKKSKTIAVFEPLNMKNEIVEIKEKTVELDTIAKEKESFEIKKKIEEERDIEDEKKKLKKAEEESLKQADSIIKSVEKSIPSIRNGIGSEPLRNGCKAESSETASSVKHEVDDTTKETVNKSSSKLLRRSSSERFIRRGPLKTISEESRTPPLTNGSDDLHETITSDENCAGSITNDMNNGSSSSPLESGCEKLGDNTSEKTAGDDETTIVENIESLSNRNGNDDVELNCTSDQKVAVDEQNKDGRIRNPTDDELYEGEMTPTDKQEGNEVETVKMMEFIRDPMFRVAVEGTERMIADIKFETMGIHVYCCRFQEVDCDITIKSQVLHTLIPSKSPMVFLDLSVGSRRPRRVYIQLWGQLRRARNFLALCLGDHGPSFLNSKLLQTYNLNEPGERILGGDHEYNCGRGGREVLSDLEWNGDYIMPMKEGLLTAAGSGQQATNSLFLICTREDLSRNFSCPFGQIVEGLSSVREAVTLSSQLDLEVWVVQCGLVLQPPGLS